MTDDPTSDLPAPRPQDPEDSRSERAADSTSIARVAGLIGHDFNNHLAVIMGSLQLLIDRLGPEDRSSRLAFRAAERAAQYTARLLTIAGRRALHIEPIDPAELLAACRAKFCERCGADLAVTLSADDDTWPIAADRAILAEVIDGLAANAVQAVPSGGRLTIGARNLTLGPGAREIEPDLPTGDYVALSFVDSGPGMTPDLLARACEPFFTTKETGVLGLGLAMAQGFARQSGGALSLASSPARGTTVTLTLPRAAPRPDWADPEAEVRDGRGEKILLVEDNEELREYIETLLTLRGYQVTAVAESGQALAIIDKGRRFDLLLTDVVLTGGMNGAALARRVRDFDPAIKVLFITGFARDAFGSGEPEGGDPVLQKPFTADQLFGHLQALLAQRSTDEN